MIRHIVFFSAKRQEDVEAMRAGLTALGTIPHSSLFEVSLNSKVDPLSDEIDVVVYAEFPDEAALAAYKAHPTYAETTATVRPLRELRLSADIVAANDAVQRRD
ncbi:Dabb family protein [Mesorhizobium sp. KR9-304]|uniref:Dabb family protein n=1 Tax=Mesorhizobium sp. KR9-304 TaxID=3156614 RepID=UPI0032B41CA4